MVNIKRKVNVIEDIDGRKTVFIHDIIFKGKKSVNWDDVEKYLKQYVGDIYTIDDSNDTVYIGTDLPDEYTHSNYTHILRGANAKAKANAAQGLPELIEIAAGKKYTENHKENIWKMQCMVGIDMSQDLLCQCLMKLEKLKDIMFLM